jgi:hypothetical protein
MANGEYAKYVVSDLRLPETMKPEGKARYSKFATRILWMDDKVVPGAFQMNCAWYLRPPETQINSPHTHDYDEIIGFFSSDSTNPWELGAEIEFWVGDERFDITKSTMIFAPKGIPHCPMIIKRVDRPVFHFTVVNGGQYKINPMVKK